MVITYLDHLLNLFHNPNMLSQKKIQEDRHALLAWYKTNSRPLPWRLNREAYKIWISEIMLQQTTVAAVVPFFENFIKSFSTVESLARASVEDVLSHWSGLGYYSRARNLHKAAQTIVQLGAFPEKFEELLKLPGIGPYTSRAVASIAFGQQVGVVDGNVIRVLSRFYGIDTDWWKPKEMKPFQNRADQLALGEEPHLLNQSLMELGATICTPKSPTCMLCPWQKRCFAYREDKIHLLPRPKPRRTRESWLWIPLIDIEKNKLALAINDYAPFLKGQLFLPGRVQKLTAPPKKFVVKHSITHHDIFVSHVENGKASTKLKGLKRVQPAEIKKHVQVSLVAKVLHEFFEGRLNSP